MSSLPVPRQMAFETLRVQSQEAKLKLLKRALSVAGAVAVGIALTAGLTVTPSSAKPGAWPDCAQRIYARLFFGLEGPNGSVAETDWDTFSGTWSSRDSPAA